MAIPSFESEPKKCGDCGTNKSGPYSKNNTREAWYRNNEKGIGFLCRSCYQKRWYNTVRKATEVLDNTI